MSSLSPNMMPAWQAEVWEGRPQSTRESSKPSSFDQPFEGRQTAVGDGFVDVVVAQPVDLQHDQPALPGSMSA